MCGLSVNKGVNECFDSVCFFWGCCGGGGGGGLWSCIMVTNGETGEEQDHSQPIMHTPGFMLCDASQTLHAKS